MTNESHIEDQVDDLDIAIVGMAGKFPGAKNIGEFWQNLANGVESVTVFDDDTLRKAGVPESLIDHPDYIKSAPVLDDPSLFDAAFFGYSPREAAAMDPQHRLFLECAWNALEHAGYNAPDFDGAIGVFGGAAMNSYFMFNGLSSRYTEEFIPTLIANDNSFLTTRASYKMNMRGPSVTVQTACSTSLVALHMAVQSLLNGECQMALAGGVSVRSPHEAGYLFVEGGVASPDGHCRPFDASAGGTLFGSGVGMVVLKPLADAIEDGDNVLAIVKGTAINNDGSGKAAYTAPSVDSQAEVIAEALGNAGVSADTITYIEAHGTGTYLGDPIEVKALTKAFRMDSQRRQFCAIGSVKSNIGHLDAAAGITGIIKTVMAMNYKQIPASINFNQPNPEIDFGRSPFYVADKMRPWHANGTPRRAGISSLGIGGTNAHVILEEAPFHPLPEPGRVNKLFVLSAKSSEALNDSAENLKNFVENRSDRDTANIAYTLQVGRHQFPYRRSFVAANRHALLEQLEQVKQTKHDDHKNRPIAFMFPGTGSQRTKIGQALYEREPIFRAAIDECLAITKNYLDYDLKPLMYPSDDKLEWATAEFERPSLGLPALFATQYATVKLLASWGIEPDVIVGHSLGEYPAAFLAGVMTLEETIALVALRGRLFESMPPGAMMALPIGADEAKKYMTDDITFAAINGPKLSTVSGPIAAIEAMMAKLAEQGIEGKRLKAKVAAHSIYIDDIMAEFGAQLRRTNLQAPQLPFLSNVTGGWIQADQATSPQYWVTHLRQPVKFSDNLATVLGHDDYVFLEIGSHVLTTLARRHPHFGDNHAVANALRHPYDDSADDVVLLNALGKLWEAGADIDWDGFYVDETRQRVPLPTYPFQRKSFWVDAQPTVVESTTITKQANVDDWFYVPSWQRIPLPKASTLPAHTLLLGGWDSTVAAKLGETVTILNQSDTDVDEIAAAVENLSSQPTAVVYAWQNYLGLIKLVQALGDKYPGESIDLTIVTVSAESVIGTETLNSSAATLLGASRVIPQENPTFSCRTLDVDEATPQDKIGAVCLVHSGAKELALRNGRLWQKSYVSAEIPSVKPALKPEGAVVITGGLGAVGRQIALHLAQTHQLDVALIGRTPLPSVKEWARLATTDPKVQLMHALQETGVNAMAFAADVADQDQLSAVLDTIRAEFGSIQGIIHAAGVASEASMVQIDELDEGGIALHFRPKIKGLKNLHELTKSDKVDFRVVTSSLAAMLGGLGHAAYSAANAYCDAFAHANPEWQSLNWDIWRHESGDDGRGGASLAELGMSPAEALETLDRALDFADEPQLVVSSGDLDARIRQWVTEFGSDGEQNSIIDELQSHPNDDRTATERKVGAVWQELLGVGHVDLDSTFTDLGGHSLLATQVTSRLRTIFRVKLTVRDLFKTPTVRSLSAAIDKLLGVKESAETEATPSENNQLDKLTAMLKMLQKMDSEQVAEMTNKP